MSALARHFNSRGVKVFGYDLTSSSLTRKLETEGMDIHYSDDPELIPEDIDLVVYTPAIPADHKELNWFRSGNYKVLKRAEVLGLLSRQYRTIAVAGTHGKTSTSSMIAHVLTYCGIEASAFLGGLLADRNSNYITGNSDYMVVEADEYDRSFLHLQPDILIVTSLDEDHMDIYGTRAQMIEAYEQLCRQIVPGGRLIVMDDFSGLFSDQWMRALAERNVQVVQLDKDFGYSDWRISGDIFEFDYWEEEAEIQDVQSTMPGLHNVRNMTAAIRAGRFLGLDDDLIKEAAAHFKGIKRRFERVHKGRFILIDDYAHHPEELSFAVQTIKSLYPSKKVTGVFQPHLYSRTADFYRGFARELEGLDEVWLGEIYPAREKPMAYVSSEMIFNLIRNDNKRLIRSTGLLDELQKEKDNIEVLFTIGASDIDKYHQKIIETIEEI